MALKQNQHIVTIEASGDLSSSQFLFGVIDSNGQVAVVSSAGGDADGVIANKPDAQGRATEFVIGGITKVTAGGSVSAGDKVQSDASGQAITAASGDHVVAKALTGGASGEVIEVILVSKHILA